MWFGNLVYLYGRHVVGRAKRLCLSHPLMLVPTPWAQILNMGPQREAVGIINVAEETDPACVLSVVWIPLPASGTPCQREIGRDQAFKYISHRCTHTNLERMALTVSELLFRVVCE